MGEQQSWWKKHEEEEKRCKARNRRCRRQARGIDALTTSGRGLTKQRKLRMTNTSLWPTLLVNAVSDFVLTQIEKRGATARAHEVTIQHTSCGGHGHAYKWGYVHIAHDRCHPRMNWQYSGISWAKKNATKTSLQSLCHIVAHEFIHTTDLVTCVRNENGRRRKQQFEFRTDNLAAEIVSEFAKVEAAIWSKYKRHRRTQRNAVLRKATAASARKAPSAKMERAEMNLAKWIAEEDRAKKNRLKWQKTVNRMNGARKAAATRAANHATPPTERT